MSTDNNAYQDNAPHYLQFTTRGDQTARQRIDELIVEEGLTFYMARALLMRTTDEQCEQLLEDLHTGHLY
jgi:hypothetical protein